MKLPFLQTLSFCLFAALPMTNASPQTSTSPPLPTTGKANPALHSFDTLMLDFLQKNHLPGGAVAVVKEGRLVYARGYGYADRETKEPFLPTSLARIASVSKPITGIAISKLVQQGKLTLETKAFPFLGLQPFLKPGTEMDSHLKDITVRQLLQHTAGWNRDKSGDIMFKHFQVAEEMGIASPPDHTSLIRWAMGQPLDFAPGTQYAYSNFGYCVLGRIIEKVTGTTYEKYVQTKILKPLGITRMRIGKGRHKERFPGEVTYYSGGGGEARSVFSAEGEAPIPSSYAFASPETMDAHGGWIASVVDLARFAAMLDSPRNPLRLNVKAVTEMYAPPPAPVSRESDGKLSAYWYACGWSVRPAGKLGRANLWHSGGMPGTSSLLVRRHDGLTWAVIFNMDGANGIDPLLHQAADAVQAWPQEDNFNEYR